MKPNKCKNCGSEAALIIQEGAKFCSWFCSLLYKEKKMIGDKVPADDITEDQWEGSVCAECGGNLVEGGKFVSLHKDGCTQDDIGDFSGSGAPASIWMNDGEDDVEGEFKTKSEV